MRIKSIEIQGFKSFGDKQILELNPKTNVIVGPNGSGKSNLIDAVNWVLGEQNARSLRGEKMEDIIFSGSATKRPVGMAQVVLWVDNSDGDIPLDYRELTITRRLFRSGESQFRINKIPCRLKDIRELFAGTGSGRGSLSLMSQGQVDQILNSKPSYRREVFEEAAGISKYRARQKEAMYQLTKMERDVAYLSQIAAEIESNMYLLKNEAQKAQEYLEVRKEKNYLESVLITRDMTRLYRETAVCRYQKEAVSLALEKIELQKNRFQQLLQGPAQELRVKREHKEEAAREEVRLQLEKEHLADRLAIAWERKTWLEKRVQECTVFLEKSSRDLKDLIYKKEAEKESLEKLRQEIKDCRVDLDLQKQQSDAINSKIMLTERKSKRINGEYVEALSIKAQIGNKLSSVEKELSMTEKETDSSAARLKGLRENCMKLDSKIVSDRKICTTLHKKLETLTQENAGCEEKVKDLEHRLVQVQHELQNARDNHVQVKSKQKLLAEMHKKYEGYAFPVQELLKHGHELPGICGVVGDLLEVPEKYRIAVEIALGAKVNNIVTETTETAKEAIQFLKKRNAGRLTFLPLDVLHSKGQAEMKSLTGIRLASQVVKIEAQYQAVADYLLGRILVVEDLEAGLQAAGKTGYKFTIVTEKGEMLHPGGALTGGSLKKGSGGLVGRKKTIEQLSGEATRLSDKISAINMTKTDIEKAIAQEREKAAISAAEITKVSMRIQEIETGITYSANQVQALQREESLMLEEQSQLRHSREEILRSKTALLGSNSRLERRLVKIKYILERRDSILGDLRKSADALGVLMRNMEIKLSTLEQKYNYVQQNIEQFKGLQRDMTARHSERKKDYEACITDALALEREILKIEGKIRLNEQALKEILSTKEELENSTAHLEEIEYIFERVLGRVEAGKQEFERNYSAVKSRYLDLQHEIKGLEQALERSSSLEIITPYIVDSREIVGLEKKVASLRRRLNELEPVNISSIQEYAKAEKEKAGFAGGIEDIKKAQADLQQISRLVERRLSRQFSRFFGRLQGTFNETFHRVFRGGCGQLLLEGDSVLEGDIEIFVQPPGKRQQPLSLLSGGERALTALTLLFAMLEENRSPFCILDEVDTSLDENNIENFTNLLEYYSGSTQFIVVSHRQGTMEAADNLFGVTMPEDGISTIVSVNLQREVG